ncbi:hypothetical protein PC9H_007361 [Pleurotus ostreatus]|uniref:Uncharacterized protein n=1 Tax=Pleurotus ostreatus TaxID=5322 RepID=A0A8H6ZTS5_PLEOS|nr:uncharacterized protein PC9H_007361 [Pleurotus ostreatus]KAF7428141.1 hypothetical protein PC9H_007361 [Pleurotus ostreatus]
MAPFFRNRCNETSESSGTGIKSNACDERRAGFVASQDVAALPQTTQTDRDLEAGACPNHAPPVPTSAHPTADLPLSSPQLGDQTADPPTTGPNPPMLCSSYPEFLPVPPRYFKRSGTVPRVHHDIKIPPLSIRMTDDAPVGWTRYEHPKGPTYFHHESKNIFTNTLLGTSANLDTISRFITSFESFVSDNRIHLDPSSELVFALSESGKSAGRCGYYLVDHQNRTVFWLDEFNAAYLPDWRDVPGVMADAHIRGPDPIIAWFVANLVCQDMNSRLCTGERASGILVSILHVFIVTIPTPTPAYPQCLLLLVRRHCEFFPHTREVTQGLVDELRDMITHALGDISNYPLSIIEDTTDELKTMLDIVAAAETQVKKLAPASFATLTRHRFINFHGQPSARSACSQTMYDGSTGRSYFSMLSYLLHFGGPQAYLRVLGGAYVDRMVNATHVNQVVSRLTVEWQDFILIATVLLNANVALLAIQSVDNGNSHGIRSPIQIASYMSIASSIGSIIAGLLLVRQNRSKGPASPLRLLSNHSFNLQLMALTYSLPWNFLMLSILSFMLSFGILCFSSDPFTCLIVGALCFTVATLLIFNAWYCRETDIAPKKETPPNPPKALNTTSDS